MDTNDDAPQHRAQVAPALEALLDVEARIGRACQRVSRDPKRVQLIAASKTISADRLETFITGGLRLYGENRVQEARGKWPDLKSRVPDIRLHLIGPLQSNKAADAVELFDVIQSLDRVSLAEALGKAFHRAGRQVSLFVQVNIGCEPQKAGVRPEDTDKFISDCRRVYGFNIDGLMCIPPEGHPPARYFASLAELAEGNGLINLSMGMSSDFELAVECGATHVRVGSAIFGSRPSPACDPTEAALGLA